MARGSFVFELYVENRCCHHLWLSPTGRHLRSIPRNKHNRPALAKEATEIQYAFTSYAIHETHEGVVAGTLAWGEPSEPGASLARQGASLARPATSQGGQAAVGGGSLMRFQIYPPFYIYAPYYAGPTLYAQPAGVRSTHEVGAPLRSLLPGPPESLARFLLTMPQPRRPSLGLEATPTTPHDYTVTLLGHSLIDY